MMVTTDDVQRLFLQAVLSRGVLSVKLAQTLWEKCIVAVQAVNEELDLQHSESRDAWDAFVTKINRSLDSLDLEFKSARDETSGEEKYALINRKGDAIAQVATDYTPAEITYFKAIIELIIFAPNESFSVSSLVALREVSVIKPKINMSKAQAEVALGSFVAKGWLLKSKRGRYSLSTRTLLELQPYLKSTYVDEMLECTICLDVLTRGVACYTNNCKTRMHYYCFATFIRRQKACPACKARWPDSVKDSLLVPVGEDASTGDDETRRARRRRTSVNSDDEVNETVDEDETIGGQSQPSQPTQRSQRQTRGKAKAKALKHGH